MLIWSHYKNQISIRYYEAPICKTQRYFEMINERISIRCRGNASFHLWNENRRAMNRADWNPIMVISKECFKGTIGVYFQQPMMTYTIPGVPLM